MRRWRRWAPFETVIMRNRLAAAGWCGQGSSTCEA
jgi:hypothetical protein